MVSSDSGLLRGLQVGQLVLLSRLSLVGQDEELVVPPEDAHRPLHTAELELAHLRVGLKHQEGPEPHRPPRLRRRLEVERVLAGLLGRAAGYGYVNK